RPILSNSTQETDGPGTRFQVDATIADIYLVSSFNRSLIIGRPVIYGIIDVYSRLFTGVYVGLEGPSWTGAMMALDNMITDKVFY
ncbi:MAG TPA: transposase, partial [Flavobacteriaceae bacterium]|nr:transposase [Flavobacteriaceae bacterium]